MPARSMTPIAPASSVSSATQPQATSARSRPPTRNAAHPAQVDQRVPLLYLQRRRTDGAHGHLGIAPSPKWYSTNATGMPTSEHLA